MLSKIIYKVIITIILQVNQLKLDADERKKNCKRPPILTSFTEFSGAYFQESILRIATPNFRIWSLLCKARIKTRTILSSSKMEELVWFR